MSESKIEMWHSLSIEVKMLMMSAMIKWQQDDNTNADLSNEHCKIYHLTLATKHMQTSS